MSEAVQIALIGNGTTIAVVILGRVWSYFEHKSTAKKVEEIHIATNGMKKELEAVAYDKGVTDQKQKDTNLQQRTK